MIFESSILLKTLFFKMSVHSKPQNDNSASLNPMVFYARFQHISEKVFENLDTKSLENCREVSKQWQECIDNQNILWNKIAKNEDGNKVFQLACIRGHTKLAKVLIQKSAEINLNVNERKPYSYSAFQNACFYGNLEIAEMLVQKSTEFNIDLNLKGDEFIFIDGKKNCPHR